MEYILYLSPLISGAFLALFLVKKSYEKRDSPIGRFFFYLSCAMLFWGVTYFLELSLPYPSLYMFFGRLRYFGIGTVPIFWVSFALLYSDKVESMDKKKLTLLSIVPAFCLLMLVTNPFHSLFFVEDTPISIGPLETAESSAGPIFDLFMYYAYGLIIAGMVVILQEAVRAKDLYLKQSLMLVTGILIPFLANIIYLFELAPFLPENYDLTVLMFSISGIAIWFAIFKFRFLDIFPVARDEVFDNISDSIFVLDPKNRVVDNNRRAEMMIEKGIFPREEKDMVGKNIETLFSEIPDIIKRKGEREGGSKDARKEIKLSKDGDEKCYDVKASSFYNKHDQFIGRILIFRDITKRKQAEEKAEFLHSLLRHDLGNKLQLTMGFLELLQDSDISGEDKEFLEDSLSSIEEGIELIENVRTLQKIESDRVGGEIEAVELKKVIEESLERYDDLKKRLDFEINNHIDEEISVQGGKLLKELFTNLVENALTHSDGSRMDISSIQDEEKVKIVFEDDGKGIPDAAKDKITEKGFQGEGSSGSGLGMHLVKNIVETYEGEISVKDSKLGGARFEIVLKKY